jgi:hypothetical protein
MQEIRAVVDDFYSLPPKYRTKARLKDMVEKELIATVNAVINTLLEIERNKV